MTCLYVSFKLASLTRISGSIVGTVLISLSMWHSQNLKSGIPNWLETSEKSWLYFLHIRAIYDSTSEYQLPHLAWIVNYVYTLVYDNWILNSTELFYFFIIRFGYPRMKSLCDGKKIKLLSAITRHLSWWDASGEMLLWDTENSTCCVLPVGVVGGGIALSLVWHHFHTRSSH